MLMIIKQSATNSLPLTRNAIGGKLNLSLKSRERLVNLVYFSWLSILQPPALASREGVGGELNRYDIMTLRLVALI